MPKRPSSKLSSHSAKTPSHPQEQRWEDALHIRVSSQWTVIAVAAAVNALLFGLTYALFSPQFNTQDDVFGMLLTSGHLLVNKPDPHNINSHIALGWLVKSLYELAPNVSWYAWYMIATLYAAFTGLLAVALARRPRWDVLAVYVMLFVSCGAYALVQLQFTIVAVVAGFAGLSLIAYMPFEVSSEAPSEGKNISSLVTSGVITSRVLMLARRPSAITGTLLAVWSAMVRWEGFAMAALCVAALWLGGVLVAVLRKEFFRKGFFRKEFFRKEFFRKELFHNELVLRAPLLGLAVLLACGMQWCSISYYRAWYGADADFLEVYFEWYNVRPVLRVPMADRKDGLAIFQRHGWSPNDSEMLTNEFYLNDSLYNAPTLRSVLRDFAEYDRQLPARADVQYWYPEFLKKRRREWQERVVHSLTSPQAVAVGCAIVLMWLVVPLKWRYVLPFGGLAAAAGGILIYVHYLTLMRDPPERVVYPLLLSVACAPLVLMGRESVRLSVVRRLALGVAFVAFGWFGSVPAVKGYAAISAEAQQHSQELRTIIADLKPQPQNLYVIWSSGFPLNYVAPFQDMTVFQGFHAVWLTWCQRMPVLRATLARYGVSNLYDALYQKDNVRLLLSANQIVSKNLYYISRYATFMKQHYDVNITYRRETRVLGNEHDLEKADPYRTFAEVSLTSEP
jgi:hypothetical protein